MGSKTGVFASLDLRFQIVSIMLTLRERLVCSVKWEVCCMDVFAKHFTSCLKAEKKRDLWFEDMWIA